MAQSGAHLGRFTIQGEVLDEETEQPIPHAVVTINGQEAGRGSFRYETAVNAELVLQVAAVGYFPVDLIIRPHLDSNRSRTLTAPIRLKPIPRTRSQTAARACRPPAGVVRQADDLRTL